MLAFRCSSFSVVGYKVLGIDIDQDKVDLLNEGKSYIEHIPSDTITKSRKSGFEVTTNFARINELDAIILCVPTPIEQIPRTRSQICH